MLDVLKFYEVHWSEVGFVLFFVFLRSVVPRIHQWALYKLVHKPSQRVGTPAVFRLVALTELMMSVFERIRTAHLSDCSPRGSH